MFTHYCDHISIPVFLCLITGVFHSVSVEAAAAMAMNKYKSNRSGGSERDRLKCGSVSSTRVENYVLRQRMSGQVDWELEIGCQTQDLCSRVWKVPVCLPALYSTPFTPSLFFSASFSLDGINVNRWWPVSPLLLPCSISQGNDMKEISGVPEPMQSIRGPKLHHFILIVFPVPLPDTQPYQWIMLQWASMQVT